MTIQLLEFQQVTQRTGVRMPTGTRTPEGQPLYHACYPSLASSSIAVFPLKRLEIGQPVLAPSAAF